MPYDSYRRYQIERPKSPAEMRRADERSAHIASAISALFRPLARLAQTARRQQLPTVRRVSRRSDIPDLTRSALRVSCSAPMSAIFSPSEAAEHSGFSLETLRYYERIGLLDDIDRAPSGHRRFHDEDLEWLSVLRCLRDTGMPIAQMRRYAELARCGDGTLAERMDLLTEHEFNVQAKIDLLQAQQKHLREKIDWYRGQLSAAAH
jgi:DNA-binding transcriptional MerR regulator